MICEQRFRTKKNGKPKHNCYCKNPELIENYEKAITDTERVWICHHKKEEFYTMQELIDLGMYYNVPPEDLVFVKDEKMHQGYPHKGHEGFTEEVKRKISKNHGNKVKVQCAETGQVFDSIRAARKFVGLKDDVSIRHALKKPNYTAAGYHWRRVSNPH